MWHVPSLLESITESIAAFVPSRPNPIGLSVVELLEVRGNRLTVRGIDVAFDRVEGSRSGWLASSPEEIARRRSDRRLTNPGE